MFGEWFMSSENPNTPKEHEKQAISPETATQKKQDTITSQIPIASQSTPSKHATDKPTNGSENASNWWFIVLHVLQFVGILAGIGYALVTYVMWRDSHNNFIVQERAWLTLEGIFPPMPKEGNRIEIDARISNTGLTPAKKINAEFVPSVLGSNDRVPFDYSVKSRNVEIIGILPPNRFVIIPIVQWKIMPETLPYIKTDVDDLMNGRTYLAIYGRGTYIGIFGRSHWFRFCQWMAYNATVSAFASKECVEYNDTGDGKPPDH